MIDKENYSSILKRNKSAPCVIKEKFPPVIRGRVDYMVVPSVSIVYWMQYIEVHLYKIGEISYHKRKV